MPGGLTNEVWYCREKWWCRPGRTGVLGGTWHVPRVLLRAPGASRAEQAPGTYQRMPGRTSATLNRNMFPGSCHCLRDCPEAAASPGALHAASCAFTSKTSTEYISATPGATAMHEPGYTPIGWGALPPDSSLPPCQTSGQCSGVPLDRPRACSGAPADQHATCKAWFGRPGWLTIGPHAVPDTAQARPQAVGPAWQ